MRLIFLDIGNNGIVEVTGSIPVGSTNKIKGFVGNAGALDLLLETHRKHRHRTCLAPPAARDCTSPAHRHHLHEGSQ
jgi:hypothetical protein